VGRVSGSQIFLLASVGWCILAFGYSLVRMIAAGGLSDHAAPRGRPLAAVAYSFTWAMLPWKKESARLHPASYGLGVAFHLGTFVTFLWVAVLFFGAVLPQGVIAASSVLLGLTAACGLALLVKRIVTPALRYYSNPDDYFSNILVTGLQALAAVCLARGGPDRALLVYAGIVLFYLPLGKLRHAVFFFTARIFLGLFYGRRGVWPSGGGRSWRN
jgi:nitrate reductase gamma subunit